MNCKVTEISLVESVKDRIINNATSYIEHDYSVFIPIGENIKTLNATRLVAERKVQEINELYQAKSYGRLVSTANAVDGTLIRIHPSELLLMALNLRHELEENVSDETILSEEMLKEQDDKEILINFDPNKETEVITQMKNMTFNSKESVIQYLRTSTNPFYYKLVKKDGKWNAQLREQFRGLIPYINKLENCG